MTELKVLQLDSKILTAHVYDEHKLAVLRVTGQRDILAVPAEDDNMRIYELLFDASGADFPDVIALAILAASIKPSLMHYYPVHEASIHPNRFGASTQYKYDYGNHVATSAFIGLMFHPGIVQMDTSTTR